MNSPMGEEVCINYFPHLSKSSGGRGIVLWPSNVVTIAGCGRPTWGHLSLTFSYYTSRHPSLQLFARSVSEPVDLPKLRNEAVRDPLVRAPSVGPSKRSTNGRIVT